MTSFNRREFLKTSIMAGAGAMLLPASISYGMEGKKATGIQLYTLRDMMNENPEKTLEGLAEIGYKEIEAAGYSDGKFYGQTPHEFKKMVTDSGLRLVSGHYQTGITFPEVKGTMTNGWERAVEDAVAVDQKYMVLAYLHEEERQSIDDYYRLIELLNEKAAICKSAGLQLAYHNHDFELKEIDGKIPYHLLLEETAPELVKMEVDLYWTVKAGFDPVELFNKHKGRFPLWHVKGMDENGDFTEVGTGTIDYSRIFANSEAAGLSSYFIEQDYIKGDKWESVTTSYKNVQKVI